jgi:hypothetical protein
MCSPLALSSHASRRLRRLDLDCRCAHSRVDRRFSNELGKSLPRHHHYRCRARSRVDHAALAWFMRSETAHKMHIDSQRSRATSDINSLG